MGKPTTKKIKLYSFGKEIKDEINKATAENTVSCPFHPGFILNLITQERLLLFVETI